jgi:hypothetical protein
MDADIEVMAYRHWLYRQGRDTLGAMAYFCLTVLKNSAGRRRKRRRHVAAQYNVAQTVIKKLEELTTLKGGRDARKGEGVAHNLTSSERMWIESTIKRLIRRAADLAADPDQELPIITMAKLPHLSTNRTECP